MILQKLGTLDGFLSVDMKSGIPFHFGSFKKIGLFDWRLFILWITTWNRDRGNRKTREDDRQPSLRIVNLRSNWEVSAKWNYVRILEYLEDVHVRRGSEGSHSQ